jgi:hypothetical protein
MVQTNIIPFVLWAIGMIGGIIGIYVRMELKMKELDVRVKNLEKTDMLMNSKLDEIIKSINEVKIELVNKQNRI